MSFHITHDMKRIPGFLSRIHTFIPPFAFPVNSLIRSFGGAPFLLFVLPSFAHSRKPPRTRPLTRSSMRPLTQLFFYGGVGGGGVEPDAAFPTLLSDVPSSSIWEPSIHRRPASPSAEGAGRRLPWERCRSLRAGAGPSSSSQWAWPSSVAPPRKTDFAMGMIDGGTVRHTRQVCQMIRDWPVLSSMTLVCC